MAGSNRPLPQVQGHYALQAQGAQIMAEADARATQQISQAFLDFGRKMSAKQQASMNRSHQKGMQQTQLDAQAARWKAEHDIANTRAVLGMKKQQAEKIQAEINRHLEYGLEPPEHLTTALNNTVKSMGDLGSRGVGAATPLLVPDPG